MAYKTAYMTKEYKTKERLEFITITPEIKSFVESSGILNGTVTVQTHHVTCCLWINEDEKNLIGKNGDLMKVLDKFAPPNAEYGHNDIKDASNPNGKRNTHMCENECINGHSHAHAMLFPTSINLIVKDGKIILGRWQELMLVELDHSRDRVIREI